MFLVLTKNLYRQKTIQQHFTVYQECSAVVVVLTPQNNNKKPIKEKEEMHRVNLK